MKGGVPAGGTGILWNDPALEIGVRNSCAFTKDATNPRLAKVPRELLARFCPNETHNLADREKRPSQRGAFTILAPTRKCNRARPSSIGPFKSPGHLSDGTRGSTATHCQRPAYTRLDAAENDESKAYAINAEAPALLADEGKRLGAIFVHYSTDYVFDGTKRSPYSEKNETNPLDVYGKSKLGGEDAIRRTETPYLIFP